MQQDATTLLMGFMVQIARRTLGGGALSFESLSVLEARLRRQAFQVLQTLDLSPGYSTLHVLLVAERAD